MTKTLTILGSILAIFGVIYGLTYGLAKEEIRFQSEIAPKREAVKRKVFEQSQSYIQGKIQEIIKLRREYETEKDPTSKLALRQHILESAATVELSALPTELQTFIKTLQS